MQRLEMRVIAVQLYANEAWRARCVMITIIHAVHSVQLCSFNVKQCCVSCETADADALHPPCVLQALPGNFQEHL